MHLKEIGLIWYILFLGRGVLYFMRYIDDEESTITLTLEI